MYLCYTYNWMRGFIIEPWCLRLSLAVNTRYEEDILLTQDYKETVDYELCILDARARSVVEQVIVANL